MMVFNMQVAALGVQRLIEWVTGLRALDVTAYDTFRFFGLSGSAGIKSMKKRTDSGCPFCGESAQLLGAGDQAPMLVAPRQLKVA
jgi:hypothetical protein